MRRLVPPPQVNPQFAEIVPLNVIIQSVLGGFTSLAAAITGLVNNSYVSQLPIINDHTKQLADMQAAFDRMVLQGEALVIVDNELYYPPDDLLALDVVLLGAGAGAGAGKWDLTVDRWGGAGGAGGGDVHCRIPASLLPKDSNGHFLPIQIGIGAGGTGGTTSAQPGTGGGDTTFGTYLTAGGGQGGRAGTMTQVLPATGGSGMIPGGNGGGLAQDQTPVPPGSSYSSAELYGGGGGGGMGANGSTGGAAYAQAGGQGGISPGGQPGQPGKAPSQVVTTGGGGGGGAPNDQAPGGTGAYPSGGGGGGYGGVTTFSGGGNGGNAIAYLIERFT